MCCSVAEPWVGIVCGAIAAPVILGVSYLVLRVMKVDDTCNVVAVHGGAAMWGAICSGLFASQEVVFFLHISRILSTIVSYYRMIIYLG